MNTRHMLNQKGLSLVELMVAMVISILVIGGTLSIFTGSMQTARLNQSLTSLQSNALFAIELITNDLRMASHQGCAHSQSDSMVISADNAPTNDYGRTAVRAALVQENNWLPGMPAGYTVPTNIGVPKPGTHVLMVQYAAAPGNAISASMTATGSNITLAGENDDLIDDSFAVISNCNSSDLFQIGSISNSGGELSVSPKTNLSQAYLFNDDAAFAVRVMPFRTAIYYIGDTGRSNDSGGQIYSLYMQTFPYDLTTNPPQEIAEGVEQLQVSLGVRDGDNISYSLPDEAGLDFSEVDLVKVGLLLATRDRENTTVNRPYFLADTMVGVEGGNTDPSYTDDGRIRIAYNLSVKIRNRQP